MATVTDGEFEWHDEKAQANKAAHGVSFEEAATVFGDPNVLVLDDGSQAGRLVAIGSSVRGRPLTVVHVEVAGGRTRIISARRATRAEESEYVTNQNP